MSTLPSRVGDPRDPIPETTRVVHKFADLSEPLSKLRCVVCEKTFTSVMQSTQVPCKED